MTPETTRSHVGADGGNGPEATSGYDARPAAMVVGGARDGCQGHEKLPAQGAGIFW